MGPVHASRRLLITLVAAILLAGCGDEKVSPSTAAAVPTSTPIATPSLASTSTPTPSPSLTPTLLPTPSPAASKPISPPSAWREIPSQKSVKSVQFSDVVWTGSRFVAIGDATNGSVFLDSRDGIHWHRQAGAKGSSPLRLAVGPRGVIAVGSIGSRLASWTSADGVTWDAHPTAFPPAPNGSAPDEDWVQVTDVVARDDGWLAVGRRDPGCFFDCGLDPIRAYAWTSRDGARWTRVADQKAFTGGGMDAVARGDDGFIAAGVDTGDLAIWTSRDGLAWSRVPDAPLFHGTKVLRLGEVDIAVRDGTVVVVGTISSQDSARSRAWWSADGRTWSKASVGQAAESAMTSVAVTPGGLLATGWSVGCPVRTGQVKDVSHGALWASTDGRSWRCELSDVGVNGFNPRAVATSGTVEVAVGMTDPADAEGPAPVGSAWYRTRP